MFKTKLISVIVPTYNAEKSIERCLNSITKQTLTNLEVIVVNNGSTDNTLNIVNRLKEKDQRIRIICQENLGPAGSRNTGLLNATGEFIAWCDSDDFVDPDWLEAMYNYLIEYDADISVCRARPTSGRVSFNDKQVWIWENDECIKEFLNHKLLNGVLWNKLIKRELFNGLQFDLDLWYWEDLRIMWDIIKRAKRVVRFNKEKYNFVIHPQSMCMQNFSDKRIYADLSVWNHIVEDCKKNHTYQYPLAIEKRYDWWLGELSLMFNSDYHNTDAEKQIQKVLRAEGIKGLRRIESKTHFLFAISAIINLKVTRLLLQLVKRIKSKTK